MTMTLPHPLRWSRSIFAIGALSIVPNVHASGQTTTQYVNQVEALSQRSDIQAAFDIIERLEPQTLSDHIALTEVAAPPFAEGNRAEYYAGLLRAAGADSVWIDEVGNVLALRRGSEADRTVAVDAHLDTVFPEGTDVTVRMDGDTLRAPGIGDDTRGLVAILTVLRALNQANVRTNANLLFIGSVGEEGLGDLRGVKHIFRAGGPQITSWVGVDGISASRVTRQGLGSHRYRVTFKGPGGHSWGAFGLGNPHHALGGAIDRFVRLADEFTKTGARTSYNVGRIGGGTSVNSIPFEAWMEIDMRSESPARLNEIDALLQQAVREALADANTRRRRGEELTVDVDKIGNRPSGVVSMDTPVVQRAMAVTQMLGLEPEITIGSTNANIPISLGLPAITIGAGGNGSGAHSLDEWWVNDGGVIGIKKILMVVVAEAGVEQLTN